MDVTGTAPALDIPTNSPTGIPRLALSPKEAAVATARSEAQIFKLLRTGKLKAKKDGASTIIPIDELQRWLASLPSWESTIAA